MSSLANTSGVAAKSPRSASRRAFFGRAAALVAGVAGSTSFGTRAGLAEGPNPVVGNGPASAQVRQMLAWQARVDAARLERSRPLADHPTNGDEALYPNKIGN